MNKNHSGHRPCPFCGVWMVVRKTGRDGAANDTFECALCRTVIYVPREREPSKDMTAPRPKAACASRA